MQAKKLQQEAAATQKAQEEAAAAKKAQEQAAAAKKAEELRRAEEQRWALNPPPRSIVYNGNVYKSLADHDAHSRSVISEIGKLFDLPSAWRICPKTPDALHVCASYPWASYALVFADGSSHWTALAPPNANGDGFEPGNEADGQGCLIQEGGRYRSALVGPHYWANPRDYGTYDDCDVLLVAEEQCKAEERRKAEAVEAWHKAELDRKAAAAPSIVYNGNVYKSLADHDPHSRSVINENGNFFDLPSAWRICPKTPDALHVCASYPWATLALVFADGSAHWTALGPTTRKDFQPGVQI